MERVGSRVREGSRERDRVGKTDSDSLWKIAKLSPFWKPAAPFMPGLLPGAMIWLGLGLVLGGGERGQGQYS